MSCCCWGMRQYFNPLPPHGGRHRAVCADNVVSVISIHSLRMEGDRNNIESALIQKHFNPLPPHGGRPMCQDTTRSQTFISIHSLRMEGDLRLPLQLIRRGLFQSTPSAWRETKSMTLTRSELLHFNPLPPHGGRRLTFVPSSTRLHFNPLPPHGGRH